MYTTKEAAAALGVTPQTIRRYTKLEDDPLPAILVGRRFSVRIREDNLIEFAAKHRIAIIGSEEQQ